MARGRDVLHDHVDVDPGLGQRAEHARGDTGPVGYLLDRDLRLGDVVRDTRDDRLLHRLAFLGDPRAGGPGETRTDVDLHAVVACELDRTEREHAAARRRHLEHLVEGDVREFAGGGDDARVGAVDTLDVGVDLAGIRRQRRGQRDRRRVGAAAAQRRDVAAGRHALEAGHDRDPARVERLADPVGLDLDDLRLPVVGIGDDPGLRTGERHGRHPERLDRHAQQRHRDPLTRREQHVHLTPARCLGHVVGQAHEVVGRLAHRGHDGDHVVPGPPGPGDVVGDGTNAVGIGDGRPAELLDDEHWSLRGPSTAFNGTAWPATSFQTFRHYAVRPVTPPDKRARQKERSRAAREAREAAQKRERRKSMAIRFGIAGLLVAVAIGVASFFGGGGDDDASSTETSAPTETSRPVAMPAGCVADIPPDNPNRPTFTQPPPMTIDPAKTYTAKMSTTCGDITIALDAKNSPMTVNSFVFLAQQGFYDGLKFHRVAKDFVVQGGDPVGDGTGGPGYTIPDEPPADGYKAGVPSRRAATPGPERPGRSSSYVDRPGCGPARRSAVPLLVARHGHRGSRRRATSGSLCNPDQDPSDPSTQTTAVPLYINKVEIVES